MVVDTPDEPYGTRWTRSVGLFALLMGVAGFAGLQIVRGAFAVSIVSQSGSASVAAKSAVVEGIGAIMAPNMVKNSDGEISERWVLKAAIAHATVNGVCFAQEVSVLGQTATMVIIVPGGDDTAPSPVEVSNVIATISAASLDAEAIGPLIANQNAADVRAPGFPISLDGSPSDFGVEVTEARVSNVVGVAETATVHGIASIPGLRLRMVMGSYDCTEVPE